MTKARFAFLDHPGPIAFAHRGGALEAPENTWASFTHAQALGYHFMETDVHATRDGVVVTIHDPDLSRTSDRSGLVRDLSWKQLSAVRLTGGAGGAAGGAGGASGTGGAGDESVPRLDELIAAWPELRWNIDAKHDSVVGPLIETIHRTRALDRVCVTSFSDRRVSRVRRALGPSACVTMGPVSTTALRLASVAPERLSARTAAATAGRFRGFACAQVPIRQGRVPLVDRRFIDTAHRAGLQVHVWTVDDAATMARLLDLGVDGIMTDRPTALKDLLIQRGSWV